MKNVVAVIGTLLQMVYVFNLVDCVVSLARAPQLVERYAGEDPAMLSGLVSKALLGLAIGAAIGLVGVAIARPILRNLNDRPAWFVTVNRFFAWTWMVFVPIGTVIGIRILGWCKGDATDPDIKEQEV